jgi:hypothetical protein
VGDAIQQRQARDIAGFIAAKPGAAAVPETVVFNLITPLNVMKSIQT